MFSAMAIGFAIASIVLSLIVLTNNQDENDDTMSAIISATCTDLNGTEMDNAEAIISEGEIVGYTFDLNGTRSAIFARNVRTSVAGPFDHGRTAFHLYRCSADIISA